MTTETQPKMKVRWVNRPVSFKADCLVCGGERIWQYIHQRERFYCNTDNSFTHGVREAEIEPSPWKKSDKTRDFPIEEPLTISTLVHSSRYHSPDEYRLGMTTGVQGQVE